MKYRANNCELKAPRSIGFSHAGSTIRMKINEPWKNMQDDAACFEGWALLMRCMFKSLLSG